MDGRFVIAKTEQGEPDREAEVLEAKLQALKEAINAGEVKISQALRATFKVTRN